VVARRHADGVPVGDAVRPATHLYRADIGPFGPVRTYCGRVDRGAMIVVERPAHVTCEQCRRAMVRDWCATCGLLHVAWEPEDVCACDAQEDE
jgi:hypothetical protein